VSTGERDRTAWDWQRYVASWPVADLSPERGDVRFREVTRPRACRLPGAAF